MRWDRCRYCNGGKMTRTGETRVTPTGTEDAYKCDSCNKHPETSIWVPSNVSPPPDVKADYGSGEPTTNLFSGYAGNPADTENPSQDNQQQDSDAGYTFIYLLLGFCFLAVGLTAIFII